MTTTMTGSVMMMSGVDVTTGTVIGTGIRTRTETANGTAGAGRCSMKKSHGPRPSSTTDTAMTANTAAADLTETIISRLLSALVSWR